MESFRILTNLANGSEASLMLMAVPFFFLGIVIPIFLLWLKFSKSKESSDIPLLHPPEE